MMMLDAQLSMHIHVNPEKFSRDKRGGTERSEPASEGGSGGTPRKFSKTYIANGAISVIPELYL